MSVEDLQQVVTRPPMVPSVDSAKWRQAEEHFGIRYPDDFLSLVQAWGSGAFYDECIQLTVLSPTAPNYIETAEMHLAVLRDNMADDYRLDFKVFPETPGLYPFAWDDNGTEVCWLMAENSDAPRILVYGEDGNAQVFDSITTEFLAQVFMGKTRANAWPEPIFASDVKFMSTAPEPEPELFTLHELFMKNGNQPGFWVRNISWQIGLSMHIEAADKDGAESLTAPAGEGGYVYGTQYYEQRILCENAAAARDRRVFVPWVSPLR